MLNGLLSGAGQRDRLVAVAGLTAITALAWVYMIHAAGSTASMDGSGMKGMSMPVMQTWRLNNFLLTFLMWIVMMAGMMMPSTAPIILAFLGVKRRRRPIPHAYLPHSSLLLAT